jgi:hypothetical protein
MTYETLAQMTNEEFLSFTKLLSAVNYETGEYPYRGFDGMNCDDKCEGVNLKYLLEDADFSCRCQCGNRNVMLSYDNLYGFWVFEAY